jgi:hypothetical protein
MNYSFIFLLATMLLCNSSGFAQPSNHNLPKLKVSENHRFIVQDDGSPFVWIGETNWFFAKLPPATIDNILDRRSAQGFTIMFVSCREKLYNGAGPGKVSQPNEAWWSYLDEYVAKCAARNMYVGITLGWWGVAKSNSEKDLYDYGKWVGNRYKNANNIVWLTLGEAGGHLRKSTLDQKKLHALVQGIRDGDTGNKLLTIHADYKRGTSLSVDAQVCDFNNWQTSQWCCINDLPRKDDRQWTVWEAIQFDYNQKYKGMPKPTLDSEAWYEDNKDFCGADSYNIRRRAYFTIFAGAFGHTYGAGGIWDGLNNSEGCSKSALEAIDHEGARHMGYLSEFLQGLGNSFLELRPDQAIVAGGNSDDYDLHIQAASAVDGSFALIYSASDKPYSIALSRLSGDDLAGIWYNPRTHTYHQKFVFEDIGGVQRVDPPGALGAGNDWVLLLGQSSKITEFCSR